MNLLKGQEFLLLIIGISWLVAASKRVRLIGLVELVAAYIPNHKLSIFITSLVLGAIPVSGRVLISAPILATCCAGHSAKDMGKLGIVNYLSSHHYYLWSPLEESVILILAGLGIGYWEFLSYTWPMLVVYLTVMGLVIYFYLPKDIGTWSSQCGSDAKNRYGMWKILFLLVAGIFGSLLIPTPYAFFIVGLLALLSERFNWKEAFFAVNWKLLILVAIIIIIANWVKLFSSELEQLIKQQNHLILLLLMSGIASFILGSSTKYAGIVILLTKIWGIAYFPIFFAVEYVGYLLSPTHKCVAISYQYFHSRLVPFYTLILLTGSLILTVSFF